MKIVADTNIPYVEECFSSIGDVTLVPGLDMTADIVRDAQCLLVRSVTKVDEHLLKGSAVRFVGTATIGIDHIDLDYLDSNDIAFASAPGSNANSVAEYIVAALLNTAKKHELTLEGKSIGIVGVGNVGSRVEKKVCALGMRPVLNDPPLARQRGDAKYVGLEEVFKCDFVTVHTPLTYEGQDKTFHLVDEKFLGSLKDGAIFMNSSRGAVVDTDSLKKAIKFCKVKAAVLDVWEDEPNVDVELLSVVDIATPHIAGYSYDGKVAGMTMIYDAACECFNEEAVYCDEAFLPEPAVPEIKVEKLGVSEIDTLQAIVSAIYDIKADDSRMREMLTLPLGKRCALFSKLRKEYPIRREFQNTRVLLPPGSEAFAEKLAGIGFKV